MARNASRPALDQGYKGYGAQLVTTDAPYDPATRAGDPDDPVQYVGRPGFDFLRPWLAIRNGVAFQWPLGLQGFNLNVTPLLGRHQFIGGRDVVLEVIHAGEDVLTMNGSFPGKSSAALIQALYQVVKADAGAEGKILYIPGVFRHARRAHVSASSFTRDDDGESGWDCKYSVDFELLGPDSPSSKPSTFQNDPVISSAAPKGKSARVFKVDAKTNTLRKIARLKYKDSTKWRQLFTLNESYFTNHSVPTQTVPDYRLPIGTPIEY